MKREDARGHQLRLHTNGLTPLLHVKGDGQSSSLPHVMVQRYVVAPNWAHLASFGGPIPQSESSGRAGFAQLFERNSFNATHELIASEQTSLAAPSMLVAF